MADAQVLVVGGGPTGLFAVFMCGMMGLRCSVLEVLPALGGQCQALYPHKPIYDIPGMPSVLARDLVTQLCKQMEPFQPQIFLEEQALHASREDGGLWRVRTSCNREIQASAILLCGGAGAFTPRRPALEDLESFEGKSVFYIVTSPENFQGKEVVIAGGGDSAADWAVLLAPWVKKLHLVHRRNKFRAQDHTLAQLKIFVEQGKVELHVPYQLHGLQGESGMLSHVLIQDLAGHVQTLCANYLLPCLGIEARLDALSTWGLVMDNQRILTHPATGATNLPGVYAAGDIATYSHKVKLIVTGFAEAAQAAYQIKSFLFPDQPAFVQYSTTQGVPKIT